MSYNVVFENTQTAGGYAGIRFWTSYIDKAQFEKMKPRPDRFCSVLAEGVTEDEALNLTSLTPEVCRLTAAVQDMCYAEDGRIDIKLASFRLYNAFFAIAHDHRHRRTYFLRPGDSFPFVEIGDEPSEKNQLYRFIKETFTNPDGTINDVELAEALINLEISGILLDRLIAKI